VFFHDDTGLLVTDEEGIVGSIQEIEASTAKVRGIALPPLPRSP